MIAVHCRVLPTEKDCDKLGQVLVWNNSMGYWATSRLDRAISLLATDPTITHWQRMPDTPPCYMEQKAT